MMEEPDAEESMKRDFRLIDEMNEDPGAEDLNMVDVGPVRTILEEDLDAEVRTKTDDKPAVTAEAVHSCEMEVTAGVGDYGITAVADTTTVDSGADAMEDLDAEERTDIVDLTLVTPIVVDPYETKVQAIPGAEVYGITAATGSVPEVAEDLGDLEDVSAWMVDAVGARGVGASRAGGSVVGEMVEREI